MPLDLQWPVSLDPAGRERTVTQGTLEEVQQGVDLTLHVAVGTIESDKAFGRPEFAFTGDPEQAIRDTIAECKRVADYDLPVVGTSFTVLVTDVVDQSPESEVTL